MKRSNKEWATENCFEIWWEKLKGFSGDRVKNLCSAKRVLNRVEDLEEVRRLLIKISQTKVPVEMKETNRILLNILDYGEELPTEEMLKQYDTADWSKTFDTVEEH